MSRDTPYPHLFAEGSLAGKRLRNRVIFASIYTNFVEQGQITRRLIDFHVSRARGGAAMIIGEPLAMLRSQQSPFRASIFDSKNQDQIRHWAESVNRHGCLLLSQLQDQGRCNNRPVRMPYASGPSSIVDDLSWTVPHALSRDDIRNIIDEFAESSLLLKSLGFDGLEVSAGHGHLFHQFLSPRMNNRDDEYGGSLTNRTRALVDLLSAIRSACGSDFIIVARLPGADGLENSIGPAEAADIAQCVANLGQVDLINFVYGSHSWTLEMHVPDTRYPRGAYLESMRSLRASCGSTPVAAVGRILEPAHAESILADGSADYLMLGRALLTDAAWPVKAAQNRDHDIRKCVSCNSCWGEINRGSPIACDNNPRLGRSDEADWKPSRALRSKRITIVGAGIAGLEAAWTAAERKHQVTVLGSSQDAGGKLRICATLPDCDSMSSIYDAQLTRGTRAGVCYELGLHASLDDVLRTKPDEVILATGATMSWPRTLPNELRDEGAIRDLRDVVVGLTGHLEHVGGTAVVFDYDGMDPTYSAAFLLRSIFDRVVVVNPVECIARDESLVRRQSIYRRAAQLGIMLVNVAEPSSRSRFEDGVFIHRNILSGTESEISDVALFTYSTPRAPNLELWQPLTDAGIRLHVIGDAYAPRSAMIAVREGHAIGLAV